VPSQPPLPQEPGFRDPRDRNIHARILRLIGRGGAAFFADAARVFETDPPYQAPVHLIGHCLRELDGCIRDALEPLKVQKRDAADPESGCEKPDRHRSDIEAILRGLGIDLSGKVATAWLRAVGLEGDGKGFAALAHRRGLAAPRPLDQSVRALWDDYRLVLDAVLERFEAHFLPVTETLDHLLAIETPTAKDARVVSEQLPRSLTLAQYFFSRLENPAWIPMLRKKGFFRSPPDPVLSEDGQLITTVLWPESRYLARMAPKAPAEVLTAILDIPETRNTRVLEDIVDALLAMPASMAAPLADRVGQWLSNRLQFLLPRKLGALAERLVSAGEVDAGFKVLAALLTPERREDAAPGSLPSQVFTARFEPFEYAHILDTNLAAFTQVDGLRTIELLADLLDSAVRHSEDLREDGSTFWRRQIERSDSTSHDDIPDQLTTALLRAALALLQSDARSIASVDGVLASHSPRIFRRILLYLHLQFPDATLIRKRLLSRTDLLDHWVWYEYSSLLGAHFKDLTQEEQERLLNWIEEGPDPTPFRKPRFDGHEPDEEEVQLELREWRFERLSVIATDLPEAWKAKLDALAQEFGEAAPVQPRGASVISWVGPTSPLTDDELRGMDVDQLVEQLRTWKAPEGIDAPTAEGLGRALAQQASADPGRFAPKANAFRGLDPTYVRNLLFGLDEALRNKRPFTWPQVLELCRWAVDQKDQPGEQPKRWVDHDPDWSWTRAQVGHLVGDGLLETEGMIPRSGRELVWSIIERLVNEPERTSTEPNDSLSARQDPITESLNTVRGTGLRAALQYAVWLAREGGERVNGRAFDGAGLDALPKVRDVLEQHLDPAHESSLGVRAVYGEFLPNLAYLDEEWVAKKLSRIFPSEEGQEELRAATWESYLIHHHAYDNVFQLLRDEYAEAIERLPTETLRENGRGERHQERLAEHIMALYWRGRIPLEGDLVERLFDIAPDPVRERAITWVGLVLTNEESEAPSDEIVIRLRELWDWCLKRAQRDPQHTAELEPFGWWFASGFLGDEWAIQRFVRGLSILPKTEADHSVLDRLATITRRYPIEVLKAVELMIEGDTRGWVVEVWREKVEAVLQEVRSVDASEVRKQLRELVSKLMAKGYAEFRRFLPPGDAGAPGT
jgi:hypothetical protein